MFTFTAPGHTRSGDTRWPLHRLKEPALIRGCDIYGRACDVVLLPFDEPGIWIDVGKDAPVRISAEHLELATRSVTFRYDNFSVPVIEHFLLLLGFVTRVRAVFSNGRVPYSGSSDNFVKALAGKTAQIGWREPFALPADGLTATDGKEAYVDTSSKPGDSTLTLLVRVKYPRRLGEGKRHRIDGSLTATVTPEFLRDVSDAKSLGYPSIVQPALSLASLCGWPHYRNLTWKDWRPDEAHLRMTTREVLDHRSLDLLAVIFSAIPPDRYPVGKIESYKAGHRLDLNLARQMLRNQCR